MMNEASPPHHDTHYEIEVLLPWYITGQLDPAEAAVVDGHLTHCESCRAQLAEERELRAAVAALPFAAKPAPPDRPLPRPAAQRPWARLRQTVLRPRTATWFLSAQAAVLLGLFMFFRPATQSPHEYRTLGEAPSTRAGNAIVVFHPSASEADLRHALSLAGATIVDGPNAAGAYTIRISSDERAARLNLLRSQRSVALAEAVDGETRP